MRLSLLLLLLLNTASAQTITIHQRGKIIDTLFIANYPDTCLKRLNDSTLRFTCKAEIPEYLFILVIRPKAQRWFVRIWLEPGIKHKDLLLDYSIRTASIEEPSEYDIVTGQWKGGQEISDPAEQRKADSIAVSYIEKKPASYLSLWFLTHGLFRNDNAKKLAYFNKLDPSLHAYPEYRQAMGNLTNRKYPQLGDPFREFSLPMKNDSLFNTSAIKNKWVLLNFWSNACAPCIKEMDAMADLYKSLDKTQIEFISISLDDKLSVWKGSSHSAKILWPSVWQPDNVYGELCLHYNLVAMPYFVLFDTNKKLYAMRDGAGELENLKAVFKEKGLIK